MIPPTIKEPKELLDLWQQYKEWINNNPEEMEEVTSKGEIIIKTVSKPYTLQGFKAFCYNLGHGGIKHYFEQTEGHYAKFRGIAEHIHDEVSERVISGAITGKYKAHNIAASIARLQSNETINLRIEQPLFPDVPKDDSD